MATQNQKRRWTPDEDALLTELVQPYLRSGLSDLSAWTSIAAVIEGRTPKQCRERWCGCLDPALNKSPWTEDEVSRLLQLESQMGHSWGAIAVALGTGRSELAVRNQFYSRQRFLARHPQASPALGGAPAAAVSNLARHAAGMGGPAMQTDGSYAAPASLQAYCADPTMQAGVAAPAGGFRLGSAGAGSKRLRAGSHGVPVAAASSSGEASSSIRLSSALLNAASHEGWHGVGQGGAGVEAAARDQGASGGPPEHFMRAAPSLSSSANAAVRITGGMPPLQHWLGMPPPSGAGMATEAGRHDSAALSGGGGVLRAQPLQLQASFGRIAPVVAPHQQQHPQPIQARAAVGRHDRAAAEDHSGGAAMRQGMADGDNELMTPLGLVATVAAAAAHADTTRAGARVHQPPIAASGAGATSMDGWESMPPDSGRPLQRQWPHGHAGPQQLSQHHSATKFDLSIGSLGSIPDLGGAGGGSGAPVHYRDGMYLPSHSPSSSWPPLMYPASITGSSPRPIFDGRGIPMRTSDSLSELMQLGGPAGPDVAPPWRGESLGGGSLSFSFGLSRGASSMSRGASTARSSLAGVALVDHSVPADSARSHASSVPQSDLSPFGLDGVTPLQSAIRSLSVGRNV